MVAKVDEYLAICVDEEKEFHKTRGQTSDSFERHLTVKLPTIEGFSSFLNINNSTLYEWDKKYPDFSKALEKIIKEQQKRLLDKGLSGEYNSTIAKLILSSNHGMAERKDITTKGQAIGAETQEKIDSALDHV